MKAEPSNQPNGSIYACQERDIVLMKAIGSRWLICALCWAMLFCLPVPACVAAEAASSRIDEETHSSQAPAAPRLAAGQGAIQGAVADDFGTAVADVKLTATNDATSYSASVTVDRCGSYILILPAGTYSLLAVVPGLKMYRATKIVVRSQQVVNLPIQLHLGQKGKKLKHAPPISHRQDRAIPPCQSPSS